MKQLFISFLLLCVANSKLLSDSTSSRLNKKRGPVRLQREPKPDNKENVNKRSKRAWDDEHGSDWDSKITVTKSVLTNDGHGTAFVEWGGANEKSDTIIVLTRDPSSPPSESTLYLSKDYGKTFDKVTVLVNTKPAILSYIYKSPTNYKLFMLNDVVNNAVIVSEDEGLSWTAHTTSFSPHFIAHHPTRVRVLLAQDASTKELYLSENFGKTWEAILPGEEIENFYWKTSQFDNENQIFLTTMNKDGTFKVLESSDFFRRMKNIIYESAIEFAIADDFYFYIRKSTHLNHGNDDKDLYISFDRGVPHKANFPPDIDTNPTTEFFIADAGEGQAFVAVSHRDNMTNLYVTEHKGHNMMLALERVLYTNQASYDSIAWLEGIEPFVDFQAVEGLPGVFIASQLDTGSVGHRRIHTVMTFNKGGSWQRVQPPAYDMDGYPTECFLPDCSLHISLMFGQQYPYAKHTPLLTKANAPGILIASGNLGGSHSTLNDVFVSSDGGVEWDQVLEGSYQYAIADHGGIMVAASKDPTTFIMYSHDEGKTWYNKTVCSTLVTIYGLITETGEITSVFNLYAIDVGGSEWVILTVDFKEFLGDQCSPDDFMTWSIRDELKNTECVLGKDTKYERKKPTSHCYIGADYERYVSDEACPCRASDFECDFLYWRENPGDPCTIAEGVSESWFIPDHCEPGQKYNKTFGYVQIEGDQCRGGDRKIFEHKEVACPDKALGNLTLTVTDGNAVKLGATVTVTASTSGYIEDVYFLWYVSDGQKFQGSGYDAMVFSPEFTKPGTYTVSLTADNGSGPVVAMTVIEVDLPLVGLQLKYEPLDPAIDEGMIFIVTPNEDSENIDIGRVQYDWSTGANSFLPILLYSFHSPGRQTITVTVSNSVDSIDITASFVVSDLTVTNIAVTPVDSSSIQVAWSAPVLRPNAISTYTIRYIGLQLDDWVDIKVDGNSTSHRVTGLTPDTQYKFMLVSTSIGGGSSAESDVKIAKTLPINTLDPASDVSVSPSGHDVTVTWTAPTGNKPLEYEVQFWMSDRPSQIFSHKAASGERMLKLTDLTPGAPYTIRVRAKYPNEISAYSNVKDIQIEGTSPEEIRNLRGFPDGANSIVLTWDTPKVAVEGFHVYNGTDNSILTTVTQTTTTISDLLPWTPYLFAVEPFVGIRKGTRSNPVQAKTDPGVPGPVKDLQCYMKDGGSVLSWRAPTRANGPITNYLISNLDDSLTGIPTEVDSSTLSLPLPGLKQFETYKFGVKVEGSLFTSKEVYTVCRVTSTSGLLGPPTRVYVKEIRVASIDVMWRPPVINDNVKGYEIRYGRYKNGVKMGVEQVLETNDLFATLRMGVSPSTEYGITVAAKNGAGTGTRSDVSIAATLTPDIGSVEYELMFLTTDIERQNMEDFSNAVKEKIVSVTKISRSRLIGFGLIHADASDTKVSVWISPRDDPQTEPSTESVLDLLEKTVKDRAFVVGTVRAISGKIDHVQAVSAAHHDLAEIIIPGICGLLIVVLVAGLLYYRHRYQQMMRRYRSTSRYANNDTDDVNMIECADETDGIATNELRGGELSISSDPVASQQRPRGIRNLFERFNYTAVDQNDDLIEDDEEHLLPL